MEDKLPTCPDCGSENLSKRGKIRSLSKKKQRLKQGWKQRWNCTKCNRFFNEQKLHPAKRTPFKYTNQEWAKTNWAQYNASQLNEKNMLLDLAIELFELIKINQKQATGRPSQKIQDMLFCMILKTYTGLSSRRLISDLKTAKQIGYINKTPCYSTLMLYYNDTRLTKLLQELIHVSAIPLKLQEEAFAVDSSGFSVSKFGRWFDYRFNQELQRRLYRKCHIMIGTKTNTVTSIQITKQYGTDTKQFEPLVKKTAINFSIQEVTADKAYNVRKNYNLVSEIGAIPYIPFKKNSISAARRSAMWHKMYWYFKKYPQAFGEKYHKRSNVETTFHMIKQKFGAQLMTKNYEANVNEILCKVLCHNLCCLIAAYYELNVEASFCTQVPKKARAELLY